MYLPALVYPGAVYSNSARTGTVTDAISALKLKSSNKCASVYSLRTVMFRILYPHFDSASIRGHVHILPLVISVAVYRPRCLPWGNARSGCTDGYMSCTRPGVKIWCVASRIYRPYMLVLWGILCSAIANTGAGPAEGVRPTRTCAPVPQPLCMGTSN
jgi:hypothetical protein